MPKSKNGNTGRHLTIDGLPIVNSDKEIYVTVTKTDIARASKKDPAKCAVAKACERAFGTTARVHLGRVYVKEGDHWVRFLTPSTMRQELITFDKGGEFEPRSFRLPPPPPAKRTGKRQGSGKDTPGRSHRSKSKRSSYHIVHDVRTHAAADGNKV
jgi:hypothetical protein